MNGNVKVIDNCVLVDGKHTNFMMTQLPAYDLLEGKGRAWDVYSCLYRRAGSEFNANQRSIAAILHCGRAAVATAIELLKEYGLLEEVAAVEKTGAKRVKTTDGVLVPNTSSFYTLYMSPNNAAVLQQPEQKQEVAAVAPFTVQEIDKAMKQPQPAAAAIENKQPEQKQERQADNSLRTARIKEIAVSQGCTSKAAQNELVGMVMSFYSKSKGRYPKTSQIEFWAMLLSGGDKVNTNDCVERALMQLG